MRTPRLSIFLNVFLNLIVFSLVSPSHAAKTPPICATILAGYPPATSLTLVSDNNNFFDLDSALLNESSLGRLGEALKPKPYFGRPAPHGFSAVLFDVDYSQDVAVVSAYTTIRLGLRLKRDDEEVKLRVSLPMVDLSPLEATAQALTDIINHFDLLRRPNLLTREMNMLREDLTRLLESDAGLIIKPVFVTNALKLLDQALDLRAPLARGRSTYLGKRFAAYFQARQMIVHAWLGLGVDERRRMARDLLVRYRPAPGQSPPIESIDTEDLIDRATRGAHLFGRPWYLTVDRRAFFATKLWFELLADRGRHGADGGLFLSAPFVGDLSEVDLAKYDHRTNPLKADAVVDDDKTGSSLKNTAEDTATSPAAPAAGVNPMNADPTDADPSGPGLGV